jgi:hypothetical protein
MKKLPALTSLVDWAHRNCRLDDCRSCDDAKKELRAVKRLVRAAEREQIARAASALNPKLKPVYLQRCAELVRALEEEGLFRSGRGWSPERDAVHVECSSRYRSSH